MKRPDHCPPTLSTNVIVKAKAVAISFLVVNQTIPTLIEELVKSFSQIYASLMDKIAVQLIRETAENGLLAIS